MKNLYVSGTNILARKSNRDYHYCLLVRYPDGTNYVHSCHFTLEKAYKEFDRMIADYDRHPQDFCGYYDPHRKGCLTVFALEARQ